MGVKVTAEADVPAAIRDAVGEILERSLGPHGLEHTHVALAESEDGAPLVVIEITVPAQRFQSASSAAVRAQVGAQFELLKRLRTLQPGSFAELRLLGADASGPDGSRSAA